MKIIENIKELIFKQVQKRHPHTPRYQSYRSAQRILILFESDLLERNMQIKALIRQLKDDGKDVTAWGYVAKKKVESAVLRDYRVLGMEDFTYWGLPKDYERADIARERFDILLDLNTNDLLPLRYLSVYAQADFKAGVEREEPYLSDFMINTQGDNNPAFLFDQILHYIKQVETC